MIYNSRRGIYILAICMFFLMANIFIQLNKPSLTIAYLGEILCVFTTYKAYDKYQMPATGLYLISGDGILLFETPRKLFVKSIQIHEACPLTQQYSQKRFILKSQFKIKYFDLFKTSPI